MFIKHLTGSHAGEIEDVVFEAARTKVLTGEAEDIYDQLHLKKPAQAVVSPATLSEKIDDVEVNAAVQKKRRR